MGIIPQYAHRKGIIEIMALITQTELENRLGRTLSSDEASSFAVINQTVQAYTERMLGTKVESVSPTTRYYDGGVQNLEIDPCTQITIVSYVDEAQATESQVLDTDYAKEPINRAVKTWLRSRWGTFNTGINNVAVTAKFSIYDDADTLAIVKNAMLEMLTEILDSKESVSSESIEGYSVTFDRLSQTTGAKALKTVRQGII